MISIYTNTNDERVASYRLRYKQVFAEVNKSTRVTLNKFEFGSDVIFLCKFYGFRAIMLCVISRILRKNVYLDLCDIKLPTESGFSRLRVVLALVHKLVVSSQMQKDYYAQYIKENRIQVIDDIVEPEKIYNDHQNRRTSVPINVLYFGNELNSGKSSFELLNQIISPNLQSRVVVNVLSNNKKKFDHYFQKRPEFLYHEWSDEKFRKLITESHIVVLPYNEELKQTARSTNRLTLALANRKLVLASVIPSYKIYSDCFIPLTSASFSHFAVMSSSDLERLGFEITSQFNPLVHNSEVLRQWRDVLLGSRLITNK